MQSREIPRLDIGRLKVLAIALAVCAAGVLNSAAGEEPASKSQKSRWAPKLYGLCMGMPGPPHRTVAEQARMLGELGFDGAGYALWLDDKEMQSNLKTLDEAGLDIPLFYTMLNLKPNGPPFDPRVPQALRKLKGRNCTICVLLQGCPPEDPNGEERALEILRQLGEEAAASGLRISIYHHKGDWTESTFQALDIVKKVDRENVGVNFNLCHWLMVDGDKDYRPVLRENADKIFAVTINGARLGAKTWTNGLIQPLDQGDFDNRRLLATLRQIGYRGPIGLMCYGIPGDAREHLERSMKVWNGWKEDWRNPSPD